MARGVPLAGHKTLNYWQNRLMFDDAHGKGCDESLSISPDGIVWEGSRSNIFVVIDGELLTPPCDGRVLPGIMRALVLEQAVRLGLNVRETPLRLVDPSFRPQEVFLTNSVRGIMPVGRWGDARYPRPGRSPGGSGTISCPGSNPEEPDHEDDCRGGAVARRVRPAAVGRAMGQRGPALGRSRGRGRAGS